MGTSNSISQIDDYTMSKAQTSDWCETITPQSSSPFKTQQALEPPIHKQTVLKDYI